MLISIADDGGNALDAKIEIEPGAVILHSRGGAFGKANLRNPDYRNALRAILERLGTGKSSLSGIWLDSRVAQRWPEDRRKVLDASEFAMPVDRLLTVIGQRVAAMGRPEGATGHGNSTKRIRIGVPGLSQAELQALIHSLPSASRADRLPADVLRRVSPEMIDDAVEALEAGALHQFGESDDYDVLSPSGLRLPPQAVFGIALEKAIDRPARDTDFSAGWGQPSFDIIKHAGYDILPKEKSPSFSDPEIDEEDSWTEGHWKLGQHRRRERKPGRVRWKKRRFIAEHGHLFCERCGLVPTPALGPFGDACIEVHHTVPVAAMDGKTPIRLRDLQCLCANCHRIVHREMAC